MIYLGADHGGFELKENIKKWLSEWGYKWKDCGNTTFDKKDDYPKYAFSVAKNVAKDEKALKDAPKTPWKDRPKGILACRSAAGMVIAAGKVKGVRPVTAFEVISARHSREHNNANVLALSGDFLTKDACKKILQTWLETEFSYDERHQRRLNQIEEYESKI